MAAKNNPIDGEPNRMAQLAIDLLLNRQEDAHSTADYDRRAARRICGRWLLLRRTLRGLSRAEVARRVKLDEATLGLLEMGLTEAPLTAGDVWLRLTLVLEGPANDYEQVATVIQVALGQAPVPDEAWLTQLATELDPSPATAQALLADRTATDAPTEMLNEADQLLRARTPLPIHSLHVLRALRRSAGQPMTVPGLRKSIRAHEAVRMNVVDLRLLLERLAAREFVLYRPGDPPNYQITPVGEQALLVALQKAEAERRRDAAASEFDRFIANLPNAEAQT